MPFSYYLVNFELSFRYMYSLAILSNKHLDFVEVINKEAALPSYQTCYDNVLQNLFKDDFFCFTKLL